METGKAGYQVRVAVVDDDEDMRLLMQDLLSRTPEFECIACFKNATDALSELPKLEPDLVLMDIRMPGLSGIECTAALKRSMPWVKTIMVTGMHDADSIAKSSTAGAEYYLTKPVTPDQFIAALKFCSKDHGGHSPLSGQDAEVMRYMAEGLLYKEIADKLAICESTVHKHRHRIFLKLQVSNRSEAIHKWRQASGA
jgi:DNA-binding NarL/FixJ family response regulator